MQLVQITRLLKWRGIRVFQISDTEIQTVEHMLLADGCGFAEDARKVIRFWESTDVAACPGSGKTTVLLAKLKLMADRMPFDNGAGICVLSHTNVAVNEIKDKMSGYLGKLMNYPNYVGTIQSFIDKYVTRPYLKQKYGKLVQAVDDRTYAEHLCRIIDSRKYPQLSGLVTNKYKIESVLYKEKADYVGALYINAGGALCIGNQGAPLAGSNRPSTQQFLHAQQDMLKGEGMIKYSDAFRYAEDAVNELTEEYTDLFSSRFKYVFVDEYQDCKENQRRALAKLFDPEKCCVFHIGDPDQAIYGSDRDTEQDWQPRGDSLVLEHSNRYGQEIADVLCPLRTGHQAIKSSCGNTGNRPILIVYNMNTISLVKDEFVYQLETHNLTDAKGVYKAIGHIRNDNAAGIKVGSYWNGYDGNKRTGSGFLFWSVIDEVCNELKDGHMDRVEPIVRRLICRIFHYSGIVNAETGREHTLATLKKGLNASHFDEYREGLIAMTELPEYSRKSLSDAFWEMIDALFVGSQLTSRFVKDNLPVFFMEEALTGSVQESNPNIYVEPIRGRKIQFDTIHGVKGETHDATLYLETEIKKSSDIVRILPFLGIGKVGASSLYDYSRKLAYVGMSRPRKLLCLAVQESTYERSISAFQGWEVVDIRNRQKAD